MPNMDATRKISAPRKRKKKKGSLAPKTVYWIMVLALSMLLSACVVTSVNEVFSLSYSDEKVTFTIPDGASMGDVCDILEDAKLIDNKLLFRAFFALTASGDPKPGEYTANTYYDYRTTTKLITRKGGAKETVKVTIPEGYETRQIVDLLVKKGVSDKESIEEVLKNADFDYAFVKNLKKGEVSRLEGYLYPDTYEFYVNGDPKSAINKLLSNFNNKFTDEYAARAKSLGYSTREIITLASIIEREATDKDRKNVSSVFHNRLKINKPLESCATVQYILGERKARLTIADTEIESPYNTYENYGLPVGPIANPGIAAIEAALYPADTEYLYFAVSEDGKHAFSKTYEEHIKNANINPK